MMLLGIVWAMGAPVLILLIGAILYRTSLRFFPAVEQAHWSAASFGLPFLIVAVLWWGDRAEFDAQCASLGRSIVHETRLVDGIFLDDSTANSFGMRYLQQDRFQWMEARSIYAKNSLHTLRAGRARHPQPRGRRDIGQRCRDCNARAPQPVDERSTCHDYRQVNWSGAGDCGTSSFQRGASLLAAGVMGIWFVPGSCFLGGQY